MDNLACTTTATISMAVVQQPSVSVSVSTPSVCEGQPAVLYASGAGAFVFQPGNMSGSSATVAPLVSTVFTVSGSNWNCVDTKTIMVRVEALPPTAISGNQTLVSIGENLILNGNGAYSYLWSTNETGSSIVVSPLANTVYSLTGTNPNGCSSKVSFTLEVSECVGVESQTMGSGFKIYPNPSDGLINFFGPLTMNEATLFLYNSSGQKIYEQHLEEGSTSVDLRRCSSGLYFLQIISDGNTLFTEHIILE